MGARSRANASRGPSFVDAHTCPWYPKSSRQETAPMALSPSSARSRPARSFARAFGVGLSIGSLPFPLHQPLRRQGPHFGSGAVPRGVGQGRLRRDFHSSLARRAGARLRRTHAAARDQRAAGIDAALLAGARGPGDGAARHERDSAPRFRGAHPAERANARRRSALRDEAAFVGQGHKFQIWEPIRFAAHLEEAKARVRRLRAEIGVRAAQAAAPGARE